MFRFPRNDCLLHSKFQVYLLCVSFPFFPGSTVYEVRFKKDIDFSWKIVHVEILFYRKVVLHLKCRLRWLSLKNNTGKIIF